MTIITCYFFQAHHFLEMGISPGWNECNTGHPVMEEVLVVVEADAIQARPTSEGELEKIDRIRPVSMNKAPN
jgi:hypothetical protein